MSKPDGGPAFPAHTLDVPFADMTNPKYFGMTLRDYFAAAVLQSIVRSQDNRFNPADDATWCYQVADAMLKEREK